MSFFVFALFFISGACGLIYEVVWSRMMTLIFGRSVLAVGTVLAAFMWGLAIGSYLLGKYADKSRNPLRLYAIYEIGVGISAFIASFILMRITPIYVWAHSNFGDYPMAFAVVRFFIAFALLTLPTALMGATLPLLSRIVIKQLSRVWQELGSLYAINTVGAVAGSLLAGFYLIGHFGLHGTIAVAVMGNLTVGMVALVASFRTNLIGSEVQQSSPYIPPVIRSDDVMSRRTYRLVLLSFALSGLASFAYEIFWTRSLVFLLGNTTYAFTLMLTAFLLGIALGGYAVRFLGDIIKSPLRLFAVIEILIGVFSALAVPLLFFIVKSEAIHAFIVRYSGQLELLAVSNFLISLSLMLFPATLIGATLPLMGRVFLSDLQRTGTTVGMLYAVNTIGNVIGALLPGLIIMPVLGIQKGILLIAALNAGLGIILIFSQGKRAMLVLSATAVAFIFFGFFLLRLPIAFQFPSEYQRPRDEVLYYKEGGLVTTKVWVSTDTDYKVISVDGINIGGTSDSDYKQQLLAHLSKLLLKSYRSELSIGLGSGILVGESARHTALQKIVSVEISQGVVSGAAYFREENHNILNDPRAIVVVDDVVNFLETTADHFDIISADEKTTGKYATNSFSYSKEYYALLQKRLSPGGLVIQWMPTDLPSTQYALAVRTFLDAFPHVQLWYFPPIGRFTMSNTILIGSKDPVVIDPSWMRRTMERDPEAFTGIRKYGLTTAEDVLAHFIGTEESLRRAFPPGLVNSFDKPYYEFYSPRDYAVPSNERTLVNHSILTLVRGPDFDRFVMKGIVGAEANRLKGAFDAEEIFLKGHAAQLRGDPSPEIIGRYDQAIGLAPWDRNLRNEVVSYLNREYLRLYSIGDYADATGMLRKAAEIYPENADVHADYGWMLWRINQTDLAITELQRALAINAEYIYLRKILASIYVLRGQSEQAASQWKATLALSPNDVPTLVDYGVYLADLQLGSDALDCVRKAYRLAPKNPEVINGYARVAYVTGNLSEARHIVLKGGNYYQGNRDYEMTRATILEGS
jgi:spermidine synthase